jgi:hypothetical protein
VRSGTGLLTGAISNLATLHSTLPSRRRGGVSARILASLHLPASKGARITVAGQWRSFTALPEHSKAVQKINTQRQISSVAIQQRASSVASQPVEVKATPKIGSGSLWSFSVFRTDIFQVLLGSFPYCLRRRVHPSHPGPAYVPGFSRRGCFTGRLRSHTTPN